MKKIPYTLVLVMISLFLSACVKTGLKTINGLAKLGDYNSFIDIEYGSKAQNKLNIYLPKDKDVKSTIVFFYGGCWGQCSDLLKNDYLFVAQTLTQKGYAVIVPDYRKYPNVKFDKILSDGTIATNWIINNIENYGINSKDIYLMGHSAGAHIAAMIADDESLLKSNYQHVVGFIGLAGPYNFYPFNADYMYDLFDKKDDYFASQPIHYINGNEPPHLLLQGRNDDRVFLHNAVDMSAMLDEKGVKNKLVVFDKMSHSKILINFSKPFRKKSQVLQNIVDFIENNSSK